MSFLQYLHFYIDELNRVAQLSGRSTATNAISAFTTIVKDGSNVIQLLVKKNSIEPSKLHNNLDYNTENKTNMLLMSDLTHVFSFLNQMSIESDLNLVHARPLVIISIETSSLPVM